MSRLTTAEPLMRLMVIVPGARSSTMGSGGRAAETVPLEQVARKDHVGAGIERRVVRRRVGDGVVLDGAQLDGAVLELLLVLGDHLDLLGRGHALVYPPGIDDLVERGRPRRIRCGGGFVAAGEKDEQRDGRQQPRGNRTGHGYYLRSGRVTLVISNQDAEAGPETDQAFFEIPAARRRVTARSRAAAAPPDAVSAAPRRTCAIGWM